jgi:hypothetical protein
MENLLRSHESLTMTLPVLENNQQLGVPLDVILPYTHQATTEQITEIGVPQAFLSPEVGTEQLGVAAVIGAMGALAIRKSRMINGWRAERHSRKAVELQRNLDQRRKPAVANHDTMVPRSHKIDPTPMSRLEQIIASDPSLGPMRRVGVVDPDTGLIVDGTAHHFGTRTSGSFAESRIMESRKMANAHRTPTGSTYATRKQERHTRKMNRMRDKVSRLNIDNQMDIYWGPYGELVRDEHLLHDYLHHVDIPKKQANSIHHTANHVKERAEEARKIFDKIRSVAEGTDKKSQKMQYKIAKRQHKAAKFRART